MSPSPLGTGDPSGLAQCRPCGCCHLLCELTVCVSPLVSRRSYFLGVSILSGSYGLSTSTSSAEWHFNKVEPLPFPWPQSTRAVFSIMIISVKWWQHRLLAIGLIWARVPTLTRAPTLTRVPTLTRAHACVHATSTLHLKSILKIKRVQGYYSRFFSKLLSPKTKTSLYLLLTICSGFFVCLFWVCCCCCSPQKSKRKRWRKGGRWDRKIPVLRYLAYMWNSQNALYTEKIVPFFILDLNFSSIHCYAVSIWLAATQPPPPHMADDLWSPASILLPRNSQIVYTTPWVCASQLSIQKENVCLRNTNYCKYSEQWAWINSIHIMRKMEY